MKRLALSFRWFFLASWLAACAAQPPLPSADTGPRIHNLQVVSNSWHTSIIMPRSEISATGLLAEADDFSQASFLEFGWGDRKYYPAERKTLGITLGAALTPTPSVMHMAGLAQAPSPTSTDIEILSVTLTEKGFRRLVGAIATEFKRPEGGRAAPMGRGLYPDSHFYEARGTFHLLNTCNTWTARMLRTGGVDLSSTGVITADDLMTRLRTALSQSTREGQ